MTERPTASAAETPSTPTNAPADAAPELLTAERDAAERPDWTGVDGA